MHLKTLIRKVNDTRGYLAQESEWGISEESNSLACMVIYIAEVEVKWILREYKILKGYLDDCRLELLKTPDLANFIRKDIVKLEFAILKIQEYIKEHHPEFIGNFVEGEGVSW